MKEQNPHVQQTGLQGLAHSVERTGRWRHGATTSEEEGVSPPEPNAGRLSRRDRANARAAAQANIDDHQCCHAARPANTPRHHLGFGLGQLTDKSTGFVRPTASHLGGQYHQPRATLSPREFRVRALLASAGFGEGCPVHASSLRARSAVCLPRRN